MRLLALGGTDHVGANCYYLELGGMRFLLDCGRGFVGSRTFSPDYDALLRSKELYRLSQLDAILLSHGHFDHIGALPLFTKLCPDTPVYATMLTRELGSWLLWDRYPNSEDFLEGFHSNLESELAMERIQTVSYHRSFSVGSVRITFYEAGHVPGAAMIYMESAEHNLLFTGDFMENETFLTRGYCLPEHLKPDVILLCGTHAKHPLYKTRSNWKEMCAAVEEAQRRGVPISVTAKQLTKGVETVRFLAREFPQAPLLLSTPIWSLAEQLGRLGIPVLTENCYKAASPLRRFGIYIGGSKGYAAYHTAVNFSLHADFDQCVSLLRRFHPETTFVVHSPRDSDGLHDHALERVFPNMDIIFPVQGHLYTDAN